jgi:hypothetical protein
MTTGAEEVVPVLLDLVAAMTGLVGIEELPGQVVDQLTDVPLLPGVLALVEVDGVLRLVDSSRTVRARPSMVLVLTWQDRLSSHHSLIAVDSGSDQ